jgi:hypothetical protein
MASNTIQDGTRWGDWHLDAKTLTLVLDSGGHHYEIRLGTMTDSAHMLDWIFQLSNKNWVTNEIRGDLLRALHDLFHPQASLCGEGHDKKLDAQAHLRNLLSNTAGTTDE